MSITNEEVINEEDLKLEEVTEEELADDSVDWKAKFQETHGKLKRATTKLSKLKSKQETEKKDLGAEKIEVEKESDELTDGQLAYLTAKGIDGDEEIEFIQKHLKKTGESLRDALKDDYVQSKIKSFKNARDVAEATPTGSNRGNQTSSKNDPDYWIAKDELPPAEQVELRRKVVNEKIRRQRGAQNTNAGSTKITIK